MRLPPADLVIIDECHHATAQTWRKIIEAYPDAVLIGLTATPCRGDGRGLGGIFTTMIECPQVGELIAQGYLVKTRVYAPVDPDLRGVKTQAGDYVEIQLADRMDVAKLVGDIVTHWHKFGERRKTVAFAVNVAHSLHLRDEFVRSGVRCEHLDGETPKDERDAILARLASGETEVVSNCMVLTEGWDMPEVGCAILARPTKKMGLYRQMIGRVLRPADGKPDAIILDHSGAVYRHGLAEDPVEWTLDPEKRAESADASGAAEPRGSETVGVLAMLGAAPCRAEMPALRIPAEASAARRADGPRRAWPVCRRPRAALRHDPATRARWHGMLTHIAHERGYKPGWIAHKYKEKFGAYPPWGSTSQPIPPTPEVCELGALAHDRLRQIEDGDMSKKNSGPPFVMVTNQVLDAPAWRAMSHGARSLYVALKRRYWPNKKNNGRIYLSVRHAAKELESGRTQIIRWFRELQYYGFIVMMTAGCLGVNGKGQAPHWRLTEMSYMRGTSSRGVEDMPTMDFLKWNGVRFGDGLRRPPAAVSRREQVLQ